MKLKKLINNLPIEKIYGPSRIEIKGVSSDSKRASPGDLFVVRKGAVSHGFRYVKQAIEAGVVALLTETYDPFLQGVTQIICEKLGRDPLSVESHLARTFYAPVSKVGLIGITGTNGKTTTAYLIHHIFEKAGKKTGLVGTVECIVGEKRIPSELTTPDVHSSAKLAKEMSVAGCSFGVYEVSSHALDQGRVSALDFDIGIFTNLTQDHLDYHKTMDAYGIAKAKLFSSLGKNALALINTDDLSATKMVKECKAKIVSYGIDRPADLQALNVKTGIAGLSFDLCIGGAIYTFTSSLIGRFNVYNCLAAIGSALEKGLSIRQIQEGVATFQSAAGRLERVKNGLGLYIFVDFAHTEDALLSVLKAVRPLRTGKTILVFGCGGGRDAGKRSKMGAVADAFADLIIVTSDNPRNEDPRAIINEILTGIVQNRQVIVEEDRKLAIAKAIEMATKEDLILIVGKGHEKTQILAHKTIPFNDVEIAEQLCEEKSLLNDIIFS